MTYPSFRSLRSLAAVLLAGLVIAAHPGRPVADLAGAEADACCARGGCAPGPDAPSAPDDCCPDDGRTCPLPCCAGTPAVAGVAPVVPIQLAAAAHEPAAAAPAPPARAPRRIEHPPRG